MKKCKMEDCTNKYYGKEMCQLHYRRWYHETMEKPKIKASSGYRSWQAMIHRCNYKNSPDYDKYGGLTICNEWRNSYEAFHDYMGDKPTPAHTIDRIDNEKGYEPGNVRWATPRQQTANRRVVRKYPRGTVQERNNTWGAYIYIKKKCFRLGTYQNKHAAIAVRQGAETLLNRLDAQNANTSTKHLLLSLYRANL